MRMKNDLHIKGYPRFETGALWNSEVAYSGNRFEKINTRMNFQ